MNKEHEILITKYDDSKKRHENITKDYESAKDNLFLRNEDLRNKLRDSESILNKTKEDFT